jgi:MFS family permease
LQQQLKIDPLKQAVVSPVVNLSCLPRRRFPLYLAGALLFGFNGATWTISFAHSTELYPTHIRGSGIGTTIACGRVVSILAPLFFGVVAARWGIAVAFRVGALAWILTIVLSAVARDRRDRAGAIGGGIDRRQTDHLRPEAGFRREAGTLNFGSA